MKKFKKVVSLAIAATMLTSSLAFAISTNAAETSVEAVAIDSSLQKEVQDGVILHAFNWSYNSIKKNLPAIAAAGYSTVQTSPVQQPKDFVTSMDVANQWWKLYQPVSMSIAQNSWLGTKAELKDLCTEAEKYGIKIICDIVSNHMGNEVESNPNSLSSQVEIYQPDFYNNKNTYFRNNNLSADDSSVQKTVQGHVSACPDLNTQNKDVQNAVISLLKECIDCGVDGFRFDAAKHIETPDDGAYASDYWPTITKAASDYYTQKTGDNLYIYGEILNQCGTGRSFSSYTKYINITDNGTGDSALANVGKGNASAAATSKYSSGQDASKLVLWAESHDTYEGSSGNSSKYSDEVIVKTWAIVASRADATALYFVRPGNALMGEAGTDTTYKGTAVSEINKFHNKFVGQSEKLGSSDNVAYVVRGTSGIVLSNCGGNEKNVSISGTGLADGTYTDTVSGNKFTVSGGVLTGSIGSTGVAVVYDGETTPRNIVSTESGSFSDDTMTVTLGLDNATSGTYSLDGSTPVKYTGDITIRIGSDYKVGETINLTLTATDGKNTTSTTYYYEKTPSTSSGVYVFFNNQNKNWTLEPYNIYIYDEVSDAGVTYKNAQWPGVQMQYDEASGYYYYEVPSTNVYANEEAGADFDLAHSANTTIIVNSPKGQYPSSGKGGLLLNGKSKILTLSYPTTKSTIVDTDLVPTKAKVDATDVTKGQPLVGDGIYGDADHDGVITVDDVTLIQKFIAQITVMQDGDNVICDVSGDNKVSIDDVTMIQKYMADMGDYGRTGEKVSK
ncbi:MAG: starch-binding protein [Ruminococcus sp.]|nr:starch-binding protein [Ruminococcus sp.]